MKKIVIALALVACAAFAEAAVHTNFVGSVATRQFMLSVVAPTAKVTWSYSITQDINGSSGYAGTSCADRYAQFLAASTTNAYVCTYTNEAFSVNGTVGAITLAKGGITLGAADAYSRDGQPSITLQSVAHGYNGGSTWVWRYYFTSVWSERRDFNITLKIEPVWAWGSADDSR